MAEYVYGIVERAATTPEQPGIAGAALRLIPGPSAAALVSDVAADDLRMGRSEALAHARVLEAAAASGTVLPMRFGLVMEGPEEVQRRLLSAHDDDLRAQLESFAGKVEVNIRALYDETALMKQVVRREPEVARMREALRGRPEDATYFERIRLGELVAQAVEQIRAEDGSAIVEALRPAAVDVSVGEAAHERIALTASFLVERGGLNEFDQRLDRLAAEHRDRIHFKYTGPLPPHSFVELSGTV